MEKRINLKSFSALLFFAILAVIYGILLVSRYQFDAGSMLISRGKYMEGIAHLEKADRLLPSVIGSGFASQDRFRIYSETGQAYLALGQDGFETKKNYQELYDTLKIAREYLFKASLVDARDYINTYWTARTEDRLERTFKLLNPKEKNPYNAYTLYQQAIALRPSSSTAVHWCIRYLQFRKMTDEIPGLVERLTRIYPPSYTELKKEPFFTYQLMQRAEKGLLRALGESVLPKYALLGLSDIYGVQGDQDKSISYYKNALSLDAQSISSGEYLHLGKLYFKAGQKKESINTFLKALETSSHVINTLNEIYYRIFKATDRLEEFLEFSVKAEERGLSSDTLDMMVARCWVEMEKPQLAMARLIRLNARKPYGPAYQMLAGIARSEQDWGQMELFIHQALVLEPDNRSYLSYYLLSLKEQGKKFQAMDVERKISELGKKK